MNQSITDASQSELIDLLYDNTPKLCVANVIAAAFLCYCLIHIVDYQALMTWFSVSLLGSSILFALSVLYARNKHTESLIHKQRWKYLWCASVFGLSCIYNAFFISIVPPSLEYYSLFLGFTALSLGTSFAIAYSFNLLAISCFVLPTLIVPAIYMLFYDGHQGVLTALSLLLVFSINAFFLRNVNTGLLKSLKLSHQLEQEKQLRKVIEQELLESTRRDSLTGLFNKRYFNEILASEIGRAFRAHSQLSLLLIDIDHFSEYNEHYGHVAGDNCLVEVGHLIASLANRNGDMIARYSGEEFALLLPNIDAKGAFAFAEKLQLIVQEKRIEHLASKLTYLKSVTVSIGVTTLPMLTKVDEHTMLRRANAALNEAKLQGRNRVKYFESLDLDPDRV